jgi:hypothetical protein
MTADMKLMTKELARELEKYPLYSQDGRGDDATVVCKYFIGSYTWYVTEAHKCENGDYEFFGLVEGLYREWGYFMLSDLEAVDYHGLKVERDLYFEPTRIGDL